MCKAHQTRAIPRPVGRQPGETIACPIQVHSIDADKARQISPALPETFAQPRSRDPMERFGDNRTSASRIGLANAIAHTARLIKLNLTLSVPRGQAHFAVIQCDQPRSRSDEPYD